jgi:hypothetical protein
MSACQREQDWIGWKMLTETTPYCRVVDTGHHTSDLGYPWGKKMKTKWRTERSQRGHQGLILPVLPEGDPNLRIEI